MTLFRQMISVFTIFLLVMLAGLLALSFSDSRNYIEVELYTKAQNSASTLAVTMSQMEGDLARMEAVADATFDTGYYRTIALVGLDGEIFFEKRREDRVESAPEWFVKLIRLKPRSAFAQVSSGWQPLGTLRVESDPTEAYAYLYGLFKKILGLFMLFFAAGVGIIALVLGWILKPLQRMERQAKEVLKNHFFINRELPRTVELKRVTEAINALVGRMEEIYNNLKKQTNRNWKLEYEDEVTGLYNRRYFTTRFDECRHAADGRENGTVVAIRLGNVAEANRQIGYDVVNRIFRDVADAVRQTVTEIEEAAVCRISGVEIAVLLPQISLRRAKELAQAMQKRIREVLERDSRAGRLLYAALAVVEYDEQTSFGKLFAAMDLTLRSAQEQNRDGVAAMGLEESLPIRKSEWRSLIEQALASGWMRPYGQPVFEKKRRVLLKVAMDIAPPHVEPIPYRLYAPMLPELGLLDAYLERLFEYLRKKRPEGRVAVTLPLAYLDTTHRFEKLADWADRLKKSGVTLIVEISQAEAVRSDLDALKALADGLKERGIEVAVVRFDAARAMLERLESVAPAYVQIHKEQFVDMSKTLRESMALLLESVGARLYVAGADTKEAEALYELGAHGVVGAVLTFNEKSG